MNFARLLATVTVSLALVSASAATAAALPDTKDAAAVNAGLAAMRNFNLIVLKDLKSTQGVQGRTFVGGNLSGGSSNYFTKPGTQTGTALVVGGNITDGPKNIGNGGNVKVGGNLESGANMNGGGSVYADGNVKGVNANGASVYADGNVENVNAKDIYYGGTIKNSNGTKHAGDHTTNGLATEIAAATVAVTENLLETSEYLSTLAPTNTVTYSADKQKAIFDAGTGTGVAVFSLGDLSAALKSQSQLQVVFPSTYDMIVINVAGTDVSLPGGINFNAVTNLGTKVVWNFYEATQLNFGSKAWYGSVLAPKADVKINNFVEGTVVAKNLSQNGEIRMSNFQGQSHVFAPSNGMGLGAVPEPATWAMMILGFGAIGAVLRRKRAVLA